ncbi:MAG: hypothetical protein F4022_14615 [Gemmatimonadetes bacterium]|nr:hypothetical protein [Gemmatimonadota bacterium]
MARVRRTILLVAACALPAACAGDGSETGSADADAGAGTVDAEATGAEPPLTSHQRSIVFLDVSDETTMLLPWDFENRTGTDGVQRILRGWLGRGEQWSQFADERWVTPTTRTPWRIIPHGAARMVMGLDDVLREIYYQEGIVDLSVQPGEVFADWSGQRGDIYRLLAGTATLSDVEYPGVVVDAYIPRADGSGQVSEWGLLIGEGPLYVLLADVDGTGTSSAWGLRAGEELSWPAVTLAWGETRSFERARRDIPVLWRFRSSDGTLQGEVESVSSHLQAVDGEGAILPVLGVYEVAGFVTVDEARVAVKGFLRHAQR